MAWNGASVPESPLHGPANATYVTKADAGQEGVNVLPFASVALNTNAATSPLSSDAKSTSTSPVAMLAPYAWAAVLLMVRLAKQGLVGADTVPVTLKFESTLEVIVAVTGFVPAYDSIVPTMGLSTG